MALNLLRDNKGSKQGERAKKEGCGRRKFSQPAQNVDFGLGNE